MVVLSNSFLASGSRDFSIKIWNTNDGTEIKTLEEHKDSVKSLVMLSNGYLASGSLDNSIKIWNLIDVNKIKTFRVHLKTIS